MKLTRRLADRRLGDQVSLVGALVTRYGLVIVLAWFGFLKFFDYEAQGIMPLVEHSPFMGWLYDFLSVQAFSNMLGILEIGTAVLVAVKPRLPLLAALGSAVAVVLFVSTLSFLLTTPGAFDAAQGGFPKLSTSTGEFLIKDVVLLGASIWTLGDALLSSSAHRDLNASPVRTV